MLPSSGLLSTAFSFPPVSTRYAVCTLLYVHFVLAVYWHRASADRSCYSTPFADNKRINADERGQCLHPAFELMLYYETLVVTPFTPAGRGHWPLITPIQETFHALLPREHFRGQLIMPLLIHL